MNTNTNLTLEIIVSDHCNLQCAGCDHFASIAYPHFLTAKECEKQMILLKKKLPILNTFLLSGGEPLINPEILNICEIIRTYFENAKIKILTNGLALKDFNEQELQYFKKLNIHFLISKYPVNFDYNKQIIRLKENDIIVKIKSEKSNFIGTQINPLGTENINHFFNCVRYTKPYFILKDYKIYQCPFSCCSKQITYINSKIIIPDTKKDYLDIRDSNFNLKKLLNFKKKPKDKCRFCQDSNDIFIWHQFNNNYDYLHSVKNYFLYNYKKYLECINNKEIFLNSFEITSDLFSKQQINQSFKRMQSKIDIIIPYYKVNDILIKQLENTLKSQTFIEECTIYLISDNSPDEEKVFDAFHGYNLNCWFLKNTKREGPGVARNIGLDNCFGEYVLFLDFDDEFCHNNDLENLYEYSKKNFLTILKFFIQDQNANIIENSQKALILNNFIKINRLEFNPVFTFENLAFYDYLKIITKYIKIKEAFYPEICYQCNKSNKYLVENEFTQTNLYISKILSKYFLFFKKQEENVINDILIDIYYQLEDIINDFSFLKNENKDIYMIIKLFYIYCMLDIYEKNKNFLILNEKLEKYYCNNFILLIDNTYICNYKELKNFVKSYYHKNFELLLAPYIKYFDF